MGNPSQQLQNGISISKWNIHIESAVGIKGFSSLRKMHLKNVWKTKSTLQKSFSQFKKKGILLFLGSVLSQASKLRTTLLFYSYLSYLSYLSIPKLFYISFSFLFFQMAWEKLLKIRDLSGIFCRAPLPCMILLIRSHEKSLRSQDTCDIQRVKHMTGREEMKAWREQNVLLPASLSCNNMTTTRQSEFVVWIYLRWSQTVIPGVQITMIWVNAVMCMI